jgi:hypothetical protein
MAKKRKPLKPLRLLSTFDQLMMALPGRRPRAILALGRVG